MVRLLPIKIKIKVHISPSGECILPHRVSATFILSSRDQYLLLLDASNAGKARAN